MGSREVDVGKVWREMWEAGRKLGGRRWGSREGNGGKVWGEMGKAWEEGRLWGRCGRRW